MINLTTAIEIEITSELRELLHVLEVDIDPKTFQSLIKELDPLKTYLEIICNKSFRKVIESADTPFEDTNKEVSRLFYKILLDRFYDSQIELTSAVFRDLQLKRTCN